MNSPLPERTVSSPNRVPFRDVDMHGHVHNAVYLSYAEAAINDFLRAFGLAGEFGPGTTGRSYLVKKAELVFESPLRFDDLLDIHVELSRLGTTSLAFSARVMRGPEAVVCARAEIVWVCIDVGTGGPAPVPTSTREDLQPFLPGDHPAEGRDGPARDVDFALRHIF